MDGSREHHVKWSKLGSKSQRSYVFPHMWKLDLKVKCTHKYKYDVIFTNLEMKKKGVSWRVNSALFIHISNQQIYFANCYLTEKVWDCFLPQSSLKYTTTKSILF
jgi:hypothetical protein